MNRNQFEKRLCGTWQWILAVVFLCANAGVSELELEWDSSLASPLGGGSSGGNFYDYAPSSILENGVEYHFYCSNLESGVIEDHIALTQVSHADGAILASKQIVLAPSTGGGGAWQHVAGVWDNASGALTIYVDGVLAAQTVEAGHAALKPFGDFRVIAGSLNPAVRQTFSGLIDELRVSSIARDIAGGPDWQSPYSADAATVDLYHFDVATDPPGNTNFIDSAAPYQNGFYFDFASPGSDIHTGSKAGFGECARYGDSTGSGSRGEMFPDSPTHDVITNAITVEAWIRPDDLGGTQKIFDSIPARLELTGGALEFSVFFDDGSALSVSTGTEGAWDSQHTCDPDVVKGEFLYDGVTYTWAMFYLGEDYSPNINMHNQIGVAFAQDLAGPWVKWSGNPIVPFSSYDYWGVGQSSTTSIDGAGRLLLFYTQGDQNGTRILRRELDLSDMAAPVIAPPEAVPKDGLTSRDGSQVIFHNADFAYDSSRDRFFVVRPRHPFDADLPDFVASELQIATIEGAAIWSGSGTWQVLGHVNSTHSGKARNHNAGILRDAFGVLPSPDKLSVTFCGADEGAGWLWSYRLQTLDGTIAQQVWVDFAWTGAEDGSEAFPFSTLDSALAVAGPGCLVMCKSKTARNWTDWTGRIETPLVLTADGSKVRIGATGAKALEKGRVAIEAELSGGLEPIVDALLAAQTGESAGEGAPADQGAFLAGAAGGGAPPDQGALLAGATGMVHEAVVPFTQLDEGLYSASPGSLLAVRLRAEGGIDPASLRAPVTSTADEVRVEWQPASGDDGLSDIWVIVRPETVWPLDDIVEVTAGASTVTGVPVGPVTVQFQIDDLVDSVTPLWQPVAGEDYTAEGLDIGDGTASVAMGHDNTVHIVPEEVYAIPRRVWLPIPGDMNPEEIQLLYRHGGEAGMWYPAAQVEGWLVPDSYLYLDAHGAQYLGFLVRHAGVVNLHSGEE